MQQGSGVENIIAASERTKRLQNRRRIIASGRTQTTQCCYNYHQTTTSTSVRTKAKLENSYSNCCADLEERLCNMLTPETTKGLPLQ